LRRAKLISDAKRVVIKIGSAVLLDSEGEIDTRTLASLSKDVCALVAAGREVAVVSSGAIACGVWRLALGKRPETLPQLQAAAAVGQSLLMGMYEDALSKHGFHAGQVLLTREDMADRTRYLNARNTLRALLAAGAIPIVNENDTVAVDEIRFGENDVLSAMVANLFEADLLIMLSTVEGLHEDFEHKGRASRVLDEVEDIDARIAMLATGDKSDAGSGGMVTKLEAARMVTASGEAALIAGGKLPDVIARIFAGEKIGTLFYPTRGRMAGRKRWIGYGARARGEIVVDEGAARALRDGGKSLLPSGIVAVTGDFAAGDVVSVSDKASQVFARGLASYSAAEVRRIMGRKSSDIAKVLGSKPYDEVIHRDAMTIL
jgi:glutamate 5-kinase